MIEDKKLKRYLVLQSFCPLFLLVFIKHVGNGHKIVKFMMGIFRGDMGVFWRAIHSEALGDVIVTCFCIIWFILTVIVALGFRSLQSSSFAHHGENIIVGSEKKDSGVTFLVTFVLPLLVDDVATLRGFIFFNVLLFMVLFLLIRSDMFYQNPVLAALGYKSYEFIFTNPYNDVDGSKTYIGLTRDYIPSSKLCVKRKYIADGVFLIYND